MNTNSDSEATYCSEVEELMKLTEINNSCTNLPIRRSQRLSQKRLNGESISCENVGSYKVIRKSQPKQPPQYCKESLELKVLQKFTQDIFSTQDLRETEDLPLNDLTCNQQQLYSEVSKKNEPSNLLKKFKVSNQDLVNKISKHNASTTKRQRVITLNENTSNISVSIVVPKQEALAKIPKGDAHLDFYFKSTESAQETSEIILNDEVVFKEKLQNTSDKSASEYIKQQLPSPSDNASTKILAQDFKQKQRNKNLINKTKNLNAVETAENIVKMCSSNINEPKKQKSQNKKETRTTSTTDQQTTNTGITLFHNNETQNMNWPTMPNEFQYVKNKPVTTILTDVHPIHFKCQLSPEAALTRSLVTQPATKTPPEKTQKLPIKKKTIRSRKTLTTDKQTAKKNIKFVAKNKHPNINSMNNYATQNELKYKKNTPEAKTTQELLNRSILPDVYPSHFKYQLPPEAALTRPLVPPPIIITPANTPSYELQDSTSTSPSLPESLRGLFDSDDIKEILNIEKVAYRLYDYHVQALAVVLKLRVEYLRETLDKILKVNSNVLKNIDNAIKMPFVQDRDLFETTPGGSPTDVDIVLNSQSPNNHRVLTQTKNRL